MTKDELDYIVEKLDKIQRERMYLATVLGIGTVALIFAGQYVIDRIKKSGGPYLPISFVW